MAFKLGLKDPVPGAIPLRFATYANFRELPEPPAVFGHYDLFPADGWDILGNNDWGCCAVSGGDHQEMLWTTEGGHAAPFHTDATLADYGSITGFDPTAGPVGDNPTDQGTDIGQLADFWMSTGLVDSNGQRHKVVAVMDLNPGDLRELWLATYLFQTIGLGFAIPQSAIDQNRRQEPWDVVGDDGGSGIQGGHYVPAMGRLANGNGVLVTWGKLQEFTPAFYTMYNNQGIVALSEDMMVNAQSIDGFDDTLLREDLEQIRHHHPRRAL